MSEAEDHSRARLHQLEQNEKKSLTAEKLQFIREQPRARSEFEESSPELSYEQRRFIQKVKVGTANSPFETVYYVYGDERRAMRRFIEVNEDPIRENIQHTFSDLVDALDEYDFRVLKEEWYLYDQ